MTITVDWGAVLALVGVGGIGIAIVRLFVRDEIRKVTNGKFGRIEARMGWLETATVLLAEHCKVRLPEKAKAD